jgi:cell division protein FtsB
MTKAAQLPRQRSGEAQRHSQAVKANIDALERENKTLRDRVALLESRDAWFRDTFHPYVVQLAAAVLFTAPPDLPR